MRVGRQFSNCSFSSTRITFCHLPFQSKWLYVGTERGNTHIVNIESFILSGYVIMWNKAIELYRKGLLSTLGTLILNIISTPRICLAALRIIGTAMGMG
ncbi:hypothetical protein cypCar_00041471 [Cyprinus carpio]|nr:hypothetical protein cypCar_00041471 [Cyprinus carpio]